MLKNVLKAIKETATGDGVDVPDLGKIQAELAAAVKEGGTLDPKNYSQLKNQIDDLTGSAEGGARAIELLNEALENENETVQRTQGVVDMTSKELDGNLKKVGTYTAGIVAADSDYNSFREGIAAVGDKTIETNMQTVIDGVNKAANAVMGLSMAISSLIGVWDT